jgi:hypothetical protein
MRIIGMGARPLLSISYFSTYCVLCGVVSIILSFAKKFKYYLCLSQLLILISNSVCDFFMVSATWNLILALCVTLTGQNPTLFLGASAHLGCALEELCKGNEHDIFAIHVCCGTREYHLGY